MYDVIIIGAGASGAAIARELSRYQGRFCVLEKEAEHQRKIEFSYFNSTPTDQSTLEVYLIDKLEK